MKALFLLPLLLTGCATHPDRRELRDALTPEAREHDGEELIRYVAP